MTPTGDDPLRLVPVRFREAQLFVEGWHRHNRPPPGSLFCIGAAAGTVLVGVVIVGRPVSRVHDDGMTLEVTRTATDGTRNANSLLYGAAWRATKAIGYRRLITYTQASETGSSLRGAGWHELASLPPSAGWDRPSRPRDNGTYLSTTRTLWEAP